MSRVIVWYSCGAASAVAARMTLEKYRDRAEVVLAYCETGSEHPDNERFIADCERWLGEKIERLRSTEYSDTWSVWESRQFLRGAHGAACTTELKIAPRLAFQRPTDIHVFGYTADGSDVRRAANFRDHFPELTIETPLIAAGIDKAATLALIANAGIELPMMYKLGFRNNNCKTCVKASSPGYWSLVRQHFPDDFERMAKLSRKLGVQLARIRGSRVFLDEIPDGFPTLDPIAPACDFMCNLVETDLGRGGLLSITGLELDRKKSSDSDRCTTVAVKRRPAGRSNCPHCGGYLRPNGTRTVKYRDLSFGGKVTTLKWERQRFRCSECRRTCADTHPELHSRHMMTHRLVTSIIERSTRESNVAIAKDLGLDEKTVRNVLRVHDEGLEHY